MFKKEAPTFQARRESADRVGLVRAVGAEEVVRAQVLLDAEDVLRRAAGLAQVPAQLTRSSIDFPQNLWKLDEK